MFRYLLCVLAVFGSLLFAADAKATGCCHDNVIVSGFGVPTFVPAGTFIAAQTHFVPVQPFFVPAGHGPVVIQQDVRFRDRFRRDVEVVRIRRVRR